MGSMGRRSDHLVMDRTHLHGSGCTRYGVLRCLDVHMVRTGNMGIVVGILIIAVILWWPRKGDE